MNTSTWLFTAALTALLAEPYPIQDADSLVAAPTPAQPNTPGARPRARGPAQPQLPLHYTQMAQPHPYSPSLAAVADPQAALVNIEISWTYDAADLPDVTFPVQMTLASSIPASWSVVTTVTNATKVILVATQETSYYRVLTYSPFFGTYADPSNPVKKPALPQAVVATIKKAP